MIFTAIEYVMDFIDCKVILIAVLRNTIKVIGLWAGLKVPTL